MTYPKLKDPNVSSWSQVARYKVIPPDQIEAKAQQWRNEGKTIATLNGSFDLMHSGHLHIIYEASLQADLLVIALNSDSSIKGYKSSERPIIPLKYRIDLISAIGFVDYVTWFDELDPRQILTRIKPNIHINGAEYGINCIEAETVYAHGGTLHLVNRVPGLSTTEIIEKIRNLCD